MFLGALRRPDKETAYKQLKTHVAKMAAFVVVLRATPYVLHLLTQEKEELKLEL